jgi:hypothetical protein
MVVTACPNNTASHYHTAEGNTEMVVTACPITQHHTITLQKATLPITQHHNITLQKAAVFSNTEMTISNITNI